MSNIILYSTGCPNCLIIERELMAKNINYSKCTDTNKMIELGIEKVPVLYVNGDVLGYHEAVVWIKNWRE